jgi:hypothetical protein
MNKAYAKVVRGAVTSTAERGNECDEYREMLRLIKANAINVLLVLLAGLVWTSTAVAQVPSLDEARRLLREGQVDNAPVAIEQRLAVDDEDRHARFSKASHWLKSLIPTRPLMCSWH